MSSHNCNSAVYLGKAWPLVLNRGSTGSIHLPFPGKNEGGWLLKRRLQGRLAVFLSVECLTIQTTQGHLQNNIPCRHIWVKSCAFWRLVLYNIRVAWLNTVDMLLQVMLQPRGTSIYPAVESKNRCIYSFNSLPEVTCKQLLLLVPHPHPSKMELSIGSNS